MLSDKHKSHKAKGKVALLHKQCAMKAYTGSGTKVTGILNLRTVVELKQVGG
jgi:hypothetical protein